MGKTKGKAMKKQNASRQKEAGAERSRIKKPVIWGPTEEGAELISPSVKRHLCSALRLRSRFSHGISLKKQHLKQIEMKRNKYVYGFACMKL
ncbi:uncharacterized protein LOC116264009 isoform X2 [Nymphaea colorata]|uniref:uncharacterized protein LOC116264009 isoform X2 n=1 Tax=Nymphaea colorata TaxID=210225 RepID=UPI00214EC361|nr:uncharacterized protein LOC116264009 isoform X2 [Nymphaea colorata]